MNKPPDGHRLRQAAGLICVLLLTAVVVGAAARSGPESVLPGPATVPSPAYQGLPALTIYLVRTQNDRDALHAREAAFARDRELEGLPKRGRYQVLVAGSAVDEYISLIELWEIRTRWRRAGATGLEVVDLR